MITIVAILWFGKSGYSFIMRAQILQKNNAPELYLVEELKGKEIEGLLG